MWRRVVIAVIAALPAVTVAASARVIRAESVLPPGSAPTCRAGAGRG